MREIGCMMKPTKNKIHQKDPYNSLYDGKNAINEYFNLKRLLALTPEELFNINKLSLSKKKLNALDTSLLKPITIEENSTTEQYIYAIRLYLAKNKLFISEFSEIVGLSKVCIRNILDNKVENIQLLTKYKLFLVLGGKS